LPEMGGGQSRERKKGELGFSECKTEGRLGAQMAFLKVNMGGSFTKREGTTMDPRQRRLKKMKRKKNVKASWGGGTNGYRTYDKKKKPYEVCQERGRPKEKTTPEGAWGGGKKERQEKGMGVPRGVRLGVVTG